MTSDKIKCDFCNTAEELSGGTTRQTMSEQGWSFGALEDGTPEVRCPYHAEVVDLETFACTNYPDWRIL